MPFRGLTWLDGVTDEIRTPRAAANTAEQQRHILEIDHQIERLNLLNQALWEILSERLGITREELERKIEEVDTRDGQADGRMRHHALRCPTCQRVSNSKHWRCLYCGQEFERPITT